MSTSGFFSTLVDEKNILEGFSIKDDHLENLQGNKNKIQGFEHKPMWLVGELLMQKNLAKMTVEMLFPRVVNLATSSWFA